MSTSRSGQNSEPNRFKRHVAAIAAGESARRRGHPRDKNPHTMQTDEAAWTGWDQGWADMDRKIEWAERHANGELAE